MRVVSFALVLLAVFALSLSFAVPVEDVSDTAYDESEMLPYERTPRFSVMQPQQSVSAPTSDLPLQFQREPNRGMLVDRAQCGARRLGDSLPIVNHSLRC